MKQTTLSDGEWKLMNLLWDENPKTIREMVLALEHDTGWSKSAVNMMLIRLAEKGAVRLDATGSKKLYYPLLAREDAVRQEAKNTLEKVRAGGIGLLLSTMAEECEFSDEEIEELYAILKKGRQSHDEA